METFGEWLKRELDERRISQKELADRSGITPAQISRIISGTRGAGDTALVSIARALGIPPEQILRAAKVLPPKPEEDELAQRAEHLLRSFKTEEYRQIALATLETLLEQEERKGFNSGLTPAEQKP